MDAEQLPVLLVGGQAGKREQGQRAIAGALGRQEIAVVLSAVRVDQVHPPPGEPLEGRGLVGIDHVLHDTGDHRSSLRRFRNRDRRGENHARDLRR
jgi:hypothetical protein